MDRAIFDLKVSVEATSLYILICAILDQGEDPTLSRIRLQWNGSQDSLEDAAMELMRRGVLTGKLPLTDATLFTVNRRDAWQRP